MILWGFFLFHLIPWHLIGMGLSIKGKCIDMALKNRASLMIGFNFFIILGRSLSLPKLEGKEWDWSLWNAGEWVTVESCSAEQEAGNGPCRDAALIHPAEQSPQRARADLLGHLMATLGWSDKAYSRELSWAAHILYKLWASFSPGPFYSTLCF